MMKKEVKTCPDRNTMGPLTIFAHCCLMGLCASIDIIGLFTLCLHRGPTRDVRQLLMSSTMGPLYSIDKTSWLLQSAQPFISAVQSMGPLMVYAHSCLMGPRGLYQGIHEIVTWAFTYTLSLTCAIMCPGN